MEKKIFYSRLIFFAKLTFIFHTSDQRSKLSSSLMAALIMLNIFIQMFKG